jgi:formate hydrogenlyase subunit 3/multisubunit Na+/H+ antiporter MnhD subunit
MLLAVGIGVYADQTAGFQGGMLHLFIHGLMKALAFLAVGAVIYARAHTRSPLRVNDLSGLAGSEPLIATAFVIACLSLAGVPPLAGFVSKWQIFAAGITTDNTSLIVLTIFAAFNSVLSLAYYFPIINALFKTEVAPPQRNLPVTMRLPILLLTAALVVIGLYPSLLDGIVIPAAQTLTMLLGG